MALDLALARQPIRLEGRPAKHVIHSNQDFALIYISTRTNPITCMSEMGVDPIVPLTSECDRLRRTIVVPTTAPTRRRLLS